jgi:hypothetical protein
VPNSLSKVWELGIDRGGGEEEEEKGGGIRKKCSINTKTQIACGDNPAEIKEISFG